MKKLLRPLSITVWSLLIIIMGLTFYVNHYLPHGPMYSTGEPSCITDDRGCSEGYDEGMSNLNIPNWARLLRKYFLLPALGLGLVGILLNSKKEN